MGGTGPIGEALVQILSQTNLEVAVTSRSRDTINCNISYVKGNALDDVFLTSLLKKHNWDVIVDFMNYKTCIFKKRFDSLLENTDQYIFISSSRVYADGGVDALTEESPRLLNKVSSIDYLQSDEYALAKARQEDLLFESPFNNWTVIRPYITFDNQRLQLAIFEKEQWLHRILNHKTLILPDSILRNQTTLTYSHDVALPIYIMIRDAIGLGEVYHICSSQDLSWMQIYDIYMSAIYQCLSFRPKTLFLDDTYLNKICPSAYQLKYDRKFHRRFNSAKIINATGVAIGTDVAKQLEQSTIEFLKNPIFRELNIRNEAMLDVLANDPWSPRGLHTPKNWFRYLYHRLTIDSNHAI